jgi:hypothetical protein
MQTLEYYQPTEAEQRLIDALRSGRYEQTIGKLESVYLHAITGKRQCCCLGVACRESEVELKIVKVGSVVGSETILFNGERGALPEEVKEELGWASAAGRLTITDRESQDEDDCPTLSSLNDSSFPFDWIADLIEAGLVRRIESDDMVTT